MSLKVRALFAKAKRGDAVALNSLYEECAGMWRRKFPVDVTGFMTFDDCDSKAKEIFLERWHMYNPADARGAKFTTWIYLVVNRRLLVKMTWLKRECRYSPFTVNFDDVLDHVKVDSGFSNVVYNLYVSRFITWLRTRESDLVVRVAEWVIHHGIRVVEELSETLRESIEDVANAVKVLKRRVVEFSQTYVCSTTLLQGALKNG